MGQGYPFATSRVEGAPVGPRRVDLDADRSPLTPHSLVRSGAESKAVSCNTRVFPSLFRPQNVGSRVSSELDPKHGSSSLGRGSTEKSTFRSHVGPCVGRPPVVVFRTPGLADRLRESGGVGPAFLGKPHPSTPPQGSELGRGVSVVLRVRGVRDSHPRRPTPTPSVP